MTAVPKGKGGVDRSALPRYADGTPWWPPGLPTDADDDALAAALRGAWGTPRWVLLLALEVREMLGGPAASSAFDLDAGTRPGTASWNLSRHHLDGLGQDALAADWRRAALLSWGRGNPAFDGAPGLVWCNFPFADPPPWVERALAAARDGCWVSVLAPHTTGAWWDDLRCAMVAEVPLRRVEFEACPGLLDARGRPARGDRPSQQCSLVTLAPPGAVAAPVAPRVLVREVPRLGPQRFAILPGPAAP